MVFSRSDIEQFIRDGYVILRNGFSPDVASEGRKFIWRELGLPPDDPSAWNQPIVHLQEAFCGSPFDRVLNSRLRSGLDQLMGESRADLHSFFGWWPVLFPGFEGPGGWHVDGSHFQHRLTSREQGLVTLYLFSDMRPGDGGTALACGTHHKIAQVLAAAEPDGLTFEELMLRLPAIDPGQIVEVTGDAGGVAFLHPFLVHGFSANTGSQVRFACNPQYQLKQAMNLDRIDGLYSPVEEAIRVGLGRTCV